MDQKGTIKTLCAWLCKQPSLSDCHVRRDHITKSRESLGLFLGAKVCGAARILQISQVDILVHGDRDVRLIIEVDPVLNPKKILGTFFAVILAKNFSPSKNRTDFWRIHKTVVLYVTVVPNKFGSQKENQIKAINRTLSDFISRYKSSIKVARVCYGHNQKKAIEEVKKVMAKNFAVTADH